jgi:hypothetical protein
MTIESLVERGTFAVDGSPLLVSSGTPDLIEVQGRKFSDKPPVLSVAGAVLYAPLAWSGLRMSESVGSFVIVNWVLVASLVLTSTAAAVAAVRLMLGTLDLWPPMSDALVLLLGLSTLLTTYGVTFNNHSVAAGLLTGAFALVYCAARRVVPGSLGRMAGVGFLAGLAAVVDIPAGSAMLLGLAGWTFGRWGLSATAVTVLAAAVPIAGHASAQWAVTRSVLPVEMRPELFEYPGSYWLTQAGQWSESGPRWQWALEFLFGPQGWLTVTPALVVGLAGLAAASFRRGPDRAAAWVAAGVTATLIAYYTFGVRRTDFAGQSFGTRHMLAVVPVIWFFAADVLVRMRHRLLTIGFGVAVTVGALFAWSGVSNPWSRIEQRSDALTYLLRATALYPWSSYQR